MMRFETFGPVTLYHGDNRKIVPALVQVDALVADGPYGIGYEVRARGVRAGILEEKMGLKATSTDAKGMIAGDDEPFNPAPWLKAPRVALFGADNFDTPAHGRTVLWDKRSSLRTKVPFMPADNHSDGEVVWLSEPRGRRAALRIHRQKWRGVCREGEENCSRSKKLHQNQKPVALLELIFDYLSIMPGMTVSDPFMGSGSTGVVAIRRGCSFVGCEIDPEHFETALQRLKAEVAAVAA